MKCYRLKDEGEAPIGLSFNDQDCIMNYKAALGIVFGVSRPEGAVFRDQDINALDTQALYLPTVFTQTRMGHCVPGWIYLPARAMNLSCGMPREEMIGFLSRDICIRV